MDPRRDLRGALRRLVDKSLSIDGTVAALYQSTADVRPVHSATLIRSCKIQEGLREKLTEGMLVRVTRTTQGMMVSEIIGKPEIRNVNPLRIRHSPAAPTNFTVSISGGTVKFRWDVPAGFKGKIKHYEILQADDDTGYSGRVFASPQGPSYAVAKVDAPTKYYAVRAVDLWEQAGTLSGWEQMAFSNTTFTITGGSRPLAVQASWAAYPDADAKYRVEVYREDQEDPIHTAVVDSTTFEYATDVPLLHTMKVTTIMPTGDTYEAGESNPVAPDVNVADTVFTLSDSAGHTQDELLALLDVSWATELVYTGDTWHWIEFATGGKIFDYITLVAAIPQIRLVIATTYDDATWKFFGLAGHEGTRLDLLGTGPLTDIETHKASYWLAQGAEGTRIAASWPKGFWKKVRVYFYTGASIGLQELIVEQRIVVGFIEAVYEIVSGGKISVRGQGGSSIQVGYWSHDTSDFGIYATDGSGRPFFVLNIPQEYLRIGFPGGKAIVIEDGDIHANGAMLEVGSVLASAISADTLSAISANLGTITAGEILMGQDIGFGFTGIQMAYPDDENPGIGIYKEGVLQAILSCAGYIQFGDATMDAEGIRQPLDVGQWSAYNELGQTAWRAGQATLFDETETFRVYNQLFWMPGETQELIAEGDSRFQTAPTSWVPSPQYHDSFGVQVRPDAESTEFFVGSNVMGFLLTPGENGRFVVGDRNPDYPMPAPLEFDCVQGELSLMRGYGRVLAKVNNTFLFVPPASPGSSCNLLYQGQGVLYMPTAGWIRRVTTVNVGEAMWLRIRFYKNQTLMDAFTVANGPNGAGRYVGFTPNLGAQALFSLSQYSYEIGGETAVYTVAYPQPDAFDFMPGDSLRVEASIDGFGDVPTGLQVWVQFLL